MTHLITSYTFDASEKTITFSGFTFDIKRVFRIVNLTRKVTIYAPGIDGLGYSSYNYASPNVVTLEFDTATASHADTDLLHIVYYPTGFIPYNLIAASSTNATSICAYPCKLGFIYVTGLTANVRYVKLYDKASAPTVGTDTPVQNYPIPTNVAGAGFVLPIPPDGLIFNNGLALAITANAINSDSTAVTANDVVINLGYLPC